MNKSLILTFVFAIASFTGAFAQKISSSPKAQPAQQESKAEKSLPAESKTPTAEPSNKKRAEKGNKGNLKGQWKAHKKGSSHAKHDKAEKGKGHNHKTEGKGRKKSTNDKNSTPSKAPVESPQNNRAQNNRAQKKSGNQ